MPLTPKLYVNTEFLEYYQYFYVPIVELSSHKKRGITKVNKIWILDYITLQSLPMSGWILDLQAISSRQGGLK